MKTEYLALEHHPHDSRIKISEDGICQSLSARMGTGGNNVPLVLVVDNGNKDDGESIRSNNAFNQNDSKRNYAQNKFR